MKISARNQLKGTVSHIQEGAVNGIVTIELADRSVKADITMDAIRDLGLEVGGEAVAVIKASSVMFADAEVKGLSARNQLRGAVVEVKEGAVNGHVAIELPDGQRVKGSITNEAISDLGIEVGGEAVAVIKSTEVMVGVE
ncbi:MULTISPECIES: molybdopterin-binding protein [unclassified Adlercreutzia]|uniref:TOBE domain-containing protein n=1 Tax=unclassified Adlercreutzia TaxID=2636013 RepID=UPI0013EC1AC1|nr:MULTISPECIES: TOBE domain-containing protein [unclassified Adlercreutzia]